jgi:hypothetical protein
MQLKNKCIHIWSVKVIGIYMSYVAKKKKKKKKKNRELW